MDNIIQIGFGDNMPDWFIITKILIMKLILCKYWDLGITE